MRKVAIVLSGVNLEREIEEEKIICADGGYNLAAGFLERVIRVVGDGDSIKGYEIENPSPTEKDYTDGETAIRLAKSLGFDEASVYGATGGRSDHVYVNLFLLRIARDIGLQAKIVTKEGHIIYKDKGEVVLRVKKGDVISVLPYAGSVVVDKSDGLFYPYDNLELTKTNTVGISNVAEKSLVKFEIKSGEALIFVSERALK